MISSRQPIRGQRTIPVIVRRAAKPGMRRKFAARGGGKTCVTLFRKPTCVYQPEIAVDAMNGHHPRQPAWQAGASDSLSGSHRSSETWRSRLSQWRRKLPGGFAI